MIGSRKSLFRQDFVLLGLFTSGSTGDATFS